MGGGELAQLRYALSCLLTSKIEIKNTKGK